MKNLTATKVCLELDISPQTLNNWYNWYKSDAFKRPQGMPELPMYEQAGPRCPRYWNQDDIEKLKTFKSWLPKGRGGVMGDYSARFWGKRGERALNNKAKMEA